ncbi:MAG: phosphate transport system permease protein pstA [Fimbriimonadaceae bacterium]|nr:phosphate transport system permease protein pstA [Fimbriimonadaceae bacterium]
MSAPGLGQLPKKNDDRLPKAVVHGQIGKRRPARLGVLLDKLFMSSTMVAAATALLLILWIAYELYSVSAPTRHRFGWSMLTNRTWDVPHEIYGALPFIYGSFLSSMLALIIAVPLAIGSAVFLTQYAPRWLASPVAFFLELLAAVPSIIFGLWGFLVLCPWMQAKLNPWLIKHFGSIPLFAGPPAMTNVLAAGLILSLMILPFITAISREVLLALPSGLKEASTGLGATKWETIRSALLPAASSGIIGAAVLGLGRAVGETMAVVMVIGNTPQIQLSLLKQGYSMPALLANEFNEAQADVMQRSALLEIALILFAFTLLLNGLARLLIRYASKTGSKRHRSDTVQKIKSAFGQALEKGLIGVVVVLLVLQISSDVQQRGAAGLVGPIEVAVLVYALIRIAAIRLAGTPRWNAFRAANDFVMRGVCGVGAVIACTGLFLLLAYVVKNGIHGLNMDLFTKLPKPAGMAGGGLKNAILGTLELVMIASAIGIPIGVLGGIFLSEHPESKLGPPIRFSADVLNGIPSVVIGLFAYAAFVLPFKHFSALAGGAALGIMMIPTVIRVTDEMMRLVPQPIRDASLGLGASRMQTTLRVVLPAAKKGVITGILLAIARVAGETAPLLFTAFGNDQVSTKLTEPVSSLTLKIYTYAQSPYDDWVAQAWAGALLLVIIILVISVTARFATRNKYA